MTTPHAAAPAAVLLLFALTACGGGSPVPSPHAGSATPVPTTSPSDDGAGGGGETDAEAALVVVTGESIQVFDTDGVAIFGTLYLDDPASLASQLGSLIGTPTVTSTAGQGTGCDSDQTMYDFGGLLIRSPGLIGATGDWEVEVDAPTTASGLPISSIGRVGVGTDTATFVAEVGDEVLLGDPGASAWWGFDVQNPEADEYEQIGVLASFDDGVLSQLRAPYYFYADC